MAIFHLSASIVKRSAGRSVTAAAAYRAAAKIEDLRTGIVHDYTRKQGVDHREIISPVSLDAIGNEWLLDREQLWNKIEEIEKRKDAQLAREITIAIPTELNRASQIELVREYVRANFVDRGMIADINIHHLDGNNPHAHVLLTMRNLQTNLEGNIEFGLKNTDWNSKDLLLAQRKSWEQITNKYLTAAGSEAKIDCRSLAEQGSPYIPQIHLGVNVAAMKRQGIATDRGDEFDRIEAANNDIRTRLEEIYQQGYTEPEQDSDIQIQLDNLDREKYRKPELEVKPELTEQQQQQIAADRKLAELIIEVMPPNPRETQTFGIYAIKPRNNNFQVRTNHNVILNLKLEDDIWVKYTRYPIKGEQRKHHYSNSDIDAKVEDFTKVIGEHKRKIDDLKIEAASEKERIRAEKERIKTEIEIQKVNREKAKAEAQIQKINNERLKPQKAEERRVRMEAQKIETKQRNLKKAEALAASRIIANAERQTRLTAQRIEARQREIERCVRHPTESESQKFRNEHKLGKLLDELLQKWGQRIFHPEDIKLVFYKIQPDQISIYIDGHQPQCTRISSFKFIDNQWINTVKSKDDRYSVDNLITMVSDQHHRFDTGEIKKLELTDLERREILGFSNWRGLELNDSRLATIREKGREIISDSLADDLVRWIDKKIPIPLNILYKDETQVISADSTQHQHIIIRREDRSNSVYTQYSLIDTKENKSLEIRHNRNRLEMISGVVTPSIAEQIKIIIDELENPEKVTSDVDRQISTPTSPPKIRSGDVARRITLISQKLANRDEQKLEEPETIESKPVTKPETIESKPAIQEPEAIESKLAIEDLRSDSAITDLIIEEELLIKVAKINQPTIKKTAKTKTRKPDRGGIE